MPSDLPLRLVAGPRVLYGRLCLCCHLMSGEGGMRSSSCLILSSSHGSVGAVDARASIFSQSEGARRRLSVPGRQCDGAITESYRLKRCAGPLPETGEHRTPPRTLRPCATCPPACQMLPLLRFFSDVRPLLPVTCPAAASGPVSPPRLPEPARAIAPRLMSDNAVSWAENGWQQPGVVVLVDSRVWTWTQSLHSV